MTKEADQPVNPTANPDFFNGTLTYEGMEREYLAYLPEKYIEETNLPLLIFLHSYGWNAEKALMQTRFDQLADEHGIVVVYPNAIPNWNSGIAENPDYPTPDTDDVGFILALINEMHTLYQIDLEQVYAAGFSNGGFMAYRLACETSGKIAAIASVGGAMSNRVYENCNPGKSLSVLTIHGTDDHYVPYNGMQSWKSAYEVFEYWTAVNACQSTEIETLADIDPEDASTVEKVSHTDCTEGNTVTLMKVKNGGHTWPGEDNSSYGQVNMDIDASEEIWQFFSEH